MAEKSSTDLIKELETKSSSSDGNKTLKEGSNTINKALQQQQQQQNASFKKPITSLTISSGKEYDRNFRPIISQNLRAQTPNGEINLLNLTKLALTNCDLKRIHVAILTQLTRLEHLDMSSNRLTLLSGFNLPRLVTLVLANNQIDHVPTNITLPRLGTLDLSSNRLGYVGRLFARSFRSLSQLNLNSNRIEQIHGDFFHRHRMPNLVRVHACGNRLKQMPFSLASTRFELLELNDNPFESALAELLPTRLEKFAATFPTLVELSSRRIVDSK